MPPWLQSIINNFNPRWIVPALVIFFAVGGRIAKALRDAAKKRQQAIARERAEIDALRTGHIAPESEAAPKRSAQTTVSAREQLEQMAAKRRAQIEAARGGRRTTSAAPPALPGQASQSQMRSPKQAPGPQAGTRTVRLPGGVILEVPEGMAQSLPTSSPDKARREQRRDKQRAEREHQNLVAQQEALEAQDRARRSVEHAKAYVQQEKSDAAAAVTQARLRESSARRLLLAPKGAFTRADLKRAIMLQTLLGPPRSAS